MKLTSQNEELVLQQMNTYPLQKLKVIYTFFIPLMGELSSWPIEIDILNVVTHYET